MGFALPLAVLLAIANGLYADVFYGLGASNGRFPVSPVLAIIVFACVRLLLPARMTTSRFDRVAAALLALGALMPSSLAAWLTLATVCGAGISADKSRAVGHRMTLGLAITQIWHGSAIKVFAAPLTGVEAGLLAICLRVLGFAPVVDHNVVAVTPGHALVLLSGCSVFSGLGVVLLGWSAVFCLLRPQDRFKGHYLAFVALAAVGLNLIRLILMALGPDWHAVVHDGWGAQIYDASVCALVITAGFLPLHSGPRAAAPGPAAMNRPPLGALLAVNAWTASGCAALFVLLVASLAIKSVRYSATDATGWRDAKQHIKGAVSLGGFEFTGQVAMTADHAIEGMTFRKAGCAEPLVIGFLGASSDTLPLISRYMGTTPVAVYLDGQPVSGWAVPQFLAVNMADIATSLVHGRKPVLHPLIAVSRPVLNASSRCAWPPAG